eukprot:SAG31_NODE_1384_length_8578_cov_2.883359_10_plen_48_part_00
MIALEENAAVVIKDGPQNGFLRKDLLVMMRLAHANFVNDFKLRTKGV